MFSHIKGIKQIERDFFILLPGSCPRGITWGDGVKNLLFQNMVMYHNKLEEDDK